MLWRRHDGPAVIASIALTAALVTLVVSASPAVAGEAADGIEIQDLDYGEVLFHFYQQDEFTALTHLLVARQTGRLTHHADDAELLLGGLYLSYGQHRKAGRIFDRLLAEKIKDPAVRSRVWFYVGKVRYQRGWFEDAEAAFDLVEADDLPDFLDAEFHLLLAQSLMGQERFSAAAQVLSAWDGPEDWLAYARYNLGVALVRMQQVDAGARLLDRVGRLATTDPELRSLRDQANLALGYAWLQAGNGDRARAVLERVRLHGPFSSKALLGVGWADSLREDYRSALDAWLELLDRDLLDSAVQESLLAVPYAFSRLNADGSAAEYYQSALSHFDAEIMRLEAAISRARAGQLIPALMRDESSGIGRWHWQLETLPASEDARYLYHLVANNQFQDGLRNYRDLRSLRRHLEEWQGKLDAFDDMVDTGTLAYAQRLPVVERSLAEIDLPAMRSRREVLAAELERIKQSRDAVGLADERELSLWRELAGMESNPAWNTGVVAAAREKRRILKGVLFWDLERAFKYRLWQQQRSLVELDAALAEADRRFERIETARESLPQRLDEFARRIDALAPRIAALQKRIDATLSVQEGQLQALAGFELEAQKQRLTTYRLQARFALATIYDHGAVAAVPEVRR